MSASIDKVFFLHIPKTAGTAFNAGFDSFVPDDRHFPHMESQPEVFDLVSREDKPFYLSGHFTLTRARHLLERPDVFSITILRRPADQLLSHLRWVKFVGSPQYPAPEAVAPPILELARNLHQTPLSDTEAVARLIDTRIGRQLFDNLQIRYLTDAKVDRVDTSGLQSAVDNLKYFDFVFALEDIDQALEALQKRIPNISTLPVTNAAPIQETVDTASPDVQEFLEAQTSYDLQLYESARLYSREHHLQHSNN